MAVDRFILEAFDREQWCPVLQARFDVPVLDVLRAALGAQADDDPELKHYYLLEPADLAAVVAAFDVPFDPAALPSRAEEVSLYRQRGIAEVPYLVHTGYELPLLLDGRKKLARMGDTYPPMRFEGEDRLDHWVAAGVLHREEVTEPFDRPTPRWHGHRTVYYTPIGEEWRIPAMKLLLDASAKSGGWNEYFERLEGALFGYADWQNDWWINVGLVGGGIGGIRLCCGVTAADLAWVKAAGFRALPPIEKPELEITTYEASKPEAMQEFLRADPDHVALAVFNVMGGQLQKLLEITDAGPWRLPQASIPELNQMLRRQIMIVDWPAQTTSS